MTRPPYPQQPWDGQQRRPVPPTPTPTPPPPAGPGPYQQQPGQPSAPGPEPTPEPSRAFKITGKQIAAAVLGILALIFILENNSTTRVRLIIPVVHFPLFIALFLSAVLGAAVTFLLMWRRQRVEERRQMLRRPGHPPPPGRNLKG
jgi:uncharacterized integral membrane protein